MGSAYPSVTTTAANKLYAEVTWDSSLKVTVYVYGVTAHEWRLKKRGYSGNTGIVYGPCTTTSETFTFDADDGGEYLFQALDDLSYTYENNSFDVSGFSVSLDDGSGDDDDDDDSGNSGGSNYPSKYLWVHEGEGTKLNIYRVWCNSKYNPLPNYNVGRLEKFNYIEEQDEHGLWRKYEVWNQDSFTIEVEALSGYTLDNYTIDGHDVNYGLLNLVYESINGGEDSWFVSYAAYDGEPRIYATANGNKFVVNEGTGGGSDGGNSGDSSGSSGNSGSGALYFDATQYGAQYAVEYHYDDDTFYIDSVKVKLAQYNSVWWAFNLTTKINDTVISSGSQNHFIDTWDWYDLGISGSADITDEVGVSLTGSAIHNSYQFNVASPTTQYVTTGNSGSGGSGSGDDDDDDGGSGGGANSSLKSYTFTALGVKAKATYTSGPEVTITILSWDGYNSIPYWRIKGVKSEGDDNTYLGQNNKSSNSFDSVDLGYGDGYDDGGKNYIFQVCKNGNWNNDGGNASKFHVDFSLGDSGGDSGGSSMSSHTLRLNQGEGTILKVERTWSDYGDYTGEDSDWDSVYLSDGDVIYYPQDRFRITAEALPGYEINYYNINGEQLPFNPENLYVPYDGEPYQLLYADDAYVSATASLSSAVRIYNGTEFVRHFCYIYDGLNWNKYIPYIYNGTSWDRY